MIQNETMNYIAGFLFITAGIIMIWIPNQVFQGMFIVSILVTFANGVLELILRIKDRTKGNLLFAAGSFLLGLFLMQNRYLPQWLIRVGFALYLIAYGFGCFVQWIINVINHIPHKILPFLIAAFSFLVGFYILLKASNVDSCALIQTFGLYTIILGMRYWNDYFIDVHPHRTYQWKRKFRISLPAILCAFIPDWALTNMNHFLATEPESTLKEPNCKEEPVLKVMVHVGPKGLQKIGHITFVYDDIVYSYGNYDSTSTHLNGTVGNGVFFKAPYSAYLPMIMDSEQNSIFEYGIYLDAKQKKLLEKELQKLESNAYRWLCKIEKENGYDHFKDYAEDYPSRLNRATGAKFYKFKSGRFKTYWALGDNCALFTDSILGKLGADVLNMRGIVSPGTYLDWLQEEYLKKGSPVISRIIHSKT